MTLLVRRLIVLGCLFLAALSIPGIAFGQVLNLSKDLESKCGAAGNMTPNDTSVNSSVLFQAGVACAVTNHYTTVIADRGSYYFNTLFSAYQHVYLNGVNNLTIDLKGSDLYFAESNIEAIGIANSTNLKLKNFTVDYQTLPFTQLTVTSVDTSTSPPTIGFTPIAGYPLPSSFNALPATLPSGYVNNGYFVYVFRNGQPLNSTGRMSVVGSPLNDSSLALAATEPWTTNATLSTIQPGDTLALEWRAGLGAIYASNTTGFTLEDISIYASGFIGAFVNLGSATTIDHVQVIPRPGTDRLLSTNADGIHLAKAKLDNVVTNNTVKRTCDDAIAMDGQWYAIVSAVLSPTSVQVTPNSGSTLAVGQVVDFINIVDATIAGTATITAESESAGIVTLTLDTPIATLQPNFGVTPDDPDLRGSGTVISGNLTQEIVFGRGIYPAGVANLAIHDNVIESTNRTGIIVEQDEGLSYNYKTGPSSGITVKNNFVDNALGYGVPSASVVTDGAAIDTVAYDQFFRWVSTQSLSNISLLNNFVTNTIRTGIRMENVNIGEVSGNTVLNSGTAPDADLWFVPSCAECEPLSQLETEFAAPVVVVNSTSVVDNSNTSAGPVVQNRSNADASYRLAPESIAVATGANFATRTETASGPTIPHKLAGVQVSVQDSAGVSRLAGLYSVSPTQVIYLVPDATASGVATVTLAGQSGRALISETAPALFSANGTGTGVALATAVRTNANGKQILEPVYECASTCVSSPLDLGPRADTVLVTFQATGTHGITLAGKMVARIGTLVVPIEAAGKSPDGEPGMDVVTLKIPHSLAGAGEVPVVLTVDGFTSNAVTINIM